MSFEKIVLVTRKTRLEGLVEKYNTRPQARFYINQSARHRGEESRDAFAFYQQEHDVYYRAIERLQDELQRLLKVQTVERAFLPNFLFTESDLVVTVGVGNDIGFETAYSAAHPDTRFELFDHTVPGLPAPLANARFRRVGAGYGNHLRPLPDLLREVLGSPAPKVLLKMDCEGAEWDCGLERVDFSPIHTFVIEIHDLLEPTNRIRTARVLAALADGAANARGAVRRRDVEAARERERRSVRACTLRGPDDRSGRAQRPPGRHAPDSKRRGAQALLPWPARAGFAPHCRWG